MTSTGTNWWVHGLTRECVQFQVDISCLVDGELDEVAGGRAIAHLEDCCPCRDFFEDARQQIRAHRDMADPDGLVRRYADLLGVDVADEIESIELVSKLSTIFYQLGKSYALLAIDPGFRTRVFERAVPVENARIEGRGFVEGVLESGRGEAAGVDWTRARHMLNGRLEKIESPLEKGRRLLREALAADPTHEEARLYLAFIDVHEGKVVRASTTFRRIFDTAVDPVNRAHAAIQLARLYSNEDEYKKALACCRWVTMSGLADEDQRFFVARYNIGTYYARLREPRRSIAAFRELLDRHPRRASEIASFFARSRKLRAVIDSQPGFTEALYEACPELFVPPADGVGGGPENES